VLLIRSALAYLAYLALIAAILAPWFRFRAFILAICAGVFLLGHQFQLSYAYAVTLSCMGAVIGARLLAWSRRTNPPLASMANVSNELAIVGGSALWQSPMAYAKALCYCSRHPASRDSAILGVKPTCEPSIRPVRGRHPVNGV